jgi:secreted trypsin-like serine protease
MLVPSTSRSRRRPLLATAAASMLACVLLLAPFALAGRSRPSPRAERSIVGGAPAAEGQYPSAAFVLDVRGRLIGQCTGAVVAPSLVLTAGHCAVNLQSGAANPGSGYRVLTGQVDWSAPGPGQLSTVVGVIPYPGYDRRFDAGDAALLVLAKPVTAPPMPLARLGQARLFAPGTRATIAGWGLTSIGSREPSKRLRYATTVLQPASWCRRHVRPFFPRWELCAIDSAHFTAGGCHGDSGGPLMVPGPVAGELVEVGIVALGQARCSTRFPNVYTRVDAVSAWLRSWIAAYSTAAVRPPAPLVPPPAG